MKNFLYLFVATAIAFAGCNKEPEPPVPVITIGTQPTAPTTLVEGSVTGSLTVAATATEGAVLSYQWYTNTAADNAGGTKIDGATAASYALPATLTAGTYYYFCEVGAPEASSVRTNAVTVTVNALDLYPVTGKAGTLDWSLTEDGTLTVGGTGTMPDYAVPAVTHADGETAPWSAYADEIKIVYIVDGVTSVGAGAFAGMTVLEEVVLPRSVESIGEGAFTGCSVLIGINIPNGTVIGDGAFDGCDSLPEGTIPDTSLQEALDRYEVRYADITAAYAGLDNSYSTLAARQSLTPATAALWDFWETAYDVIELSNTIFEQIDNINIPALNDGLPPVMSETEMEEHRGRAALYRGRAYMYLATLFGDVPLTEEVATPWTELQETSANDVNDYALENFNSAMVELSQEEHAQAFLAKIVLTANKNDFLALSLLVDELMGSATTAIYDANGDGVFNAADKTEVNLLGIQTRLLGAEANLELGEVIRAVGYLDTWTELPPSAYTSIEELRAEVHGRQWSSWNDGMKFMNEARWGNTASWGKYALMPIPSDAISANGRLTPNEGW